MELKASHKIGQLSDAEQAVIRLKADGLANRQIMAETGLNHSQVERAILKATLTESDVTRFMGLGVDLGSRAVAGREQKLSWGVMGILAGVPESQVRKAFETATQIKSKGVRIGKGGRYHYGPDRGAPLYQDVLKPTGTAIPVGANYDAAIAISVEQRITRLPREGVVRLAERYGVSSKGATAVIANRIIKAHRAKGVELAAKEAQLKEQLAPKELEAAK